MECKRCRTPIPETAGTNYCPGCGVSLDVIGPVSAPKVSSIRLSESDEIELPRPVMHIERDQEGPPSEPLLPSLPGRSRGMLAIVLFGVGILADLAGIGCLYLIQTALEGEDDTETEGLIVLSQLVEIVQGLAYLLAFIVFLIWLHRAFVNLQLVGYIRTRYSPAWAVAWFVIPLANFVKPYFVLKELWQKTIWNEEESRGSSSFPKWLWFFWLNSLWLTWKASWLLDSESLRNISKGVNYYILASLCSIASSGLLIVFINRVADRQSAKYASLIRAYTTATI